MRPALLYILLALSSTVYADICRWECRWITIDGIPAYECKLICPSDQIEFEQSHDIGDPVPPSSGANGSCKGTIREKIFRMFDGSGKNISSPVTGRWGNSFEIEIFLSQFYATTTGTLTYTDTPGHLVTKNMRVGSTTVTAHTPGHHEEGTWYYTAKATVQCSQEAYSESLEQHQAQVRMYPSTDLGFLASTPYSTTKVSLNEYFPLLLDTVTCGEQGGSMGHSGQTVTKWSADANVATVLKLTVGQEIKENYGVTKEVPVGSQGWLWRNQYRSIFDAFTYNYDFYGNKSPNTPIGTATKTFEAIEPIIESCNQ